MNMLEERLRTGLAAEAHAWPDPPAPGVVRGASRAGGWRVGLVSAAAVFAIIGGIAVANRMTGPDQGSLETAAPTFTKNLVETVVEHPVTLSDGTEVVISLPVAEGTDLESVWAAGLVRGAYDKPYSAAPFGALLHIWVNQSASEITAKIEELEPLAGTHPVRRYIVDFDGHAYDFQFDEFGDADLPEGILDEWLSGIVVTPNPDSALPIVTIGDEYEVTYGPQYSVSGTDIDGEPVVVSITEGCEVSPLAPEEYANDARVLIKSCELDGQVELLVSGTPRYVERIRGFDIVRRTSNA
ncbi:MAG: hypothetical protein MUQ27_02760 [Acidimicrobiia bacterium]|nr:hypothetical protein [Acidimicrobiia bacterium]